MEKHTYTITLNGPGYEYLMGKVPERIWRYIETKCGGDADTYMEKWGDDILPEDMRLWRGRPCVWDGSMDEEYLNSPLCVGYEMSGCAATDGAWIEVTDEDGTVVYQTEFHEDETDNVSSSGSEKAPNVVRTACPPPSGSYRYYLLLEKYDGQWMEEKVQDYRFDPSKLVLRSHRVVYDHYRQGIDLVDELWYGDEGLYRVDGTDSPESVDGYVDRFEIFDATPPSDGEMAKIIDDVNPPGCVWTSLLRRRPQLAYKCDKWSEMSGGEGALLLNVVTQFPDRYGWDGKDWASLLSKQPRFADNFDWAKLDGSAWATLLGKLPEFAGKCDWPKLDGLNWATLLGVRPQFADKCDWAKLGGLAWVALLGNQPQFADRCDWAKLDDRDWKYLLEKQPQFADKCGSNH